MSEIRITMKGNPLALKTQIISAALRAGERIAIIGKEAAMKDYKDKRKSKSPISSSLILGSFGYTLKKYNLTQARITVFAGGPDGNNPYWTKYVNDGHMLRNGVWWEGYNFMEVGMIESLSSAQSITEEELRKVKI